jgi:hypothetical protein
MHRSQVELGFSAFYTQSIFNEPLFRLPVEKPEIPHEMSGFVPRHAAMSLPRMPYQFTHLLLYSFCPSSSSLTVNIHKKTFFLGLSLGKHSLFSVP